MRVQRRLTPLLGASVLGAFLLLGCDSSNPTVPVLGAAPDGQNLFWTFTGLEPLGAGYVYEGWVIVRGAPVSTGRFDIAADGTPSLTGHILTEDEAANATAFVLTIEPADGDDPAPSDTKVLGGDIAGAAAALSIAHPAAIGDDFAGAAGQYFLETPTTASIAGDYNQGLWFLDPASGTPSLTLPTLPRGWEYEGWVVLGGTPQSTGRFSTNAGADSDGPGPAAGPDGFPPYPGQDFISPAADLLGATVVISVEPEPDDSAAPFALKPLVDGTVDDLGPGVLQALMNQSAANNPTGMVDLR
ncbi:MAG: anti-sigma factor [Acidobacteriota bacterium]